MLRCLLKIFFLLPCFLPAVNARGQGKQLSIEEYIKAYKDLAISEMQRSGVPAAITLAQGILESENGNGELAQKSNNHFGIKCKSNWTGERVYHDDDASGECFRKYSSPEESYRDHSDFLKTSERYASLFELNPEDYKSWAYGLKRAGYATNPQYPQLLIRNIEKYSLDQYTSMALGKTPQDRNASVGSGSAAKSKNIFRDKEESESIPVKTGKTRYNGLKAVYGREGVSLLVIASKYNIPLSRLIEYNDLATDGLLETDQWLYLERKNREGKQEYYEAADGETVFDIAQSQGIQLAYLLKYNNMETDRELYAGEKILLKEPPSNHHDSHLADNYVKVHRVQPREGLYSISKKYNVSVQKLREWNGLNSDKLTVGQQLIISK